MKREKKFIHNLWLLITTTLALIACPTTFFLAIVAEDVVERVICLIMCILTFAWLYMFELANGYFKGE